MIDTDIRPKMGGRLYMLPEDVEMGQVCSCAACPVALAINRYYQGLWFANVDKTFIRLFRTAEEASAQTNGGYPQWRGRTPEAASRWIALFDEDYPDTLDPLPLMDITFTAINGMEKVDYAVGDEVTIRDGDFFQAASVTFSHPNSLEVEWRTERPVVVAGFPFVRHVAKFDPQDGYRNTFAQSRWELVREGGQG